MKKQKSLNKCCDRYVLIERQSDSYKSRSKVFNQTIVISSHNATYEDVKRINEEVVKSAKTFNDTEQIDVPMTFIEWLTSYMAELDKKISISISGNRVIA